MDFDRVRAVDYSEDIVSADKTETGPSTLQVVDSLTHVTLCTENKCSNAILRVLDLLRLANLHQPFHNLSVCQPGIPENGATGLKWFDDLVRLVAGKGKSCGGGIDFHSTSQGLLGTGGHAAVICEHWRG